MSPRPVYRWKSFWLGVFVAYSIVWAGRDSMYFQTALTTNRVGTGLGAIRQEGVTFFVYGMSLDEGFWRGPVRLSETDLEGQLEDRGRGHGKVPDAVVLVAWLGLWGGWLVWHGTREKRKELR